MRIWAVAGGKGGTGKSLIANGLAAGLAGRGDQVILVDADYGAPNQHTYCGIRKPATSLAQFFENRKPLEQLIMDTAVPGFRLIPGNINSANTDSITWAQKQKLFRHLRQLRAAHDLLSAADEAGPAAPAPAPEPLPAVATALHAIGLAEDTVVPAYMKKYLEWQSQHRP